MAAFQAAWQAAATGSTPPRLEIFLDAVPEAEPAAYLRELLAVELECRIQQGESPHLAEYRHRFPDHSEIIQAVFAKRGSNFGRKRPAEQIATEAPDQLDGLGGTAGPVIGEFSLVSEEIEGLDDLDSPSAASAEGPPHRDQPLAPGTVLGNYTILGLISQGGMGAVYKAEHRRMGRTVAIKMISPTALRDAEAVQRFHRETMAMARLEHPNIVTAHDADQVGDVHILVMQYVDGDDLWTTVKRFGPLPVDMAVRCLTQTARGMDYAHREGVVHRDIKPANLVVARNGVVKILDMGLARLEKSLMEVASFDASLTQAGNIMGTVDFMAPEQALDAKSADQRADIYSLGCTFYYLLTGRMLFAGDTVMKRIMAHRFEPVPSLHAVRPDVPDWLEAVFQKMIAKETADRYQSMTELLADLESYVSSGLSSHEMDVSAPGRGSFSEDPSFAHPTAALLVNVPAAKQAPAAFSAAQTLRNTDRDTQNKPAPVEPRTAVVQEISTSRRGNAEAASRKRRRLLGSAAALGLLTSGLLLTLAAVINMGTDDGTFVIEAADEEVADMLHGAGIRVSSAKLAQPLTLQPGRHRLKTGDYEIDAAGASTGNRDQHQGSSPWPGRGGRATLKISSAR